MLGWEKAIETPTLTAPASETQSPRPSRPRIHTSTNAVTSLPSAPVSSSDAFHRAPQTYDASYSYKNEDLARIPIRVASPGTEGKPPNLLDQGTLLPRSDKTDTLTQSSDKPKRQSSVAEGALLSIMDPKHERTAQQKLKILHYQLNKSKGAKEEPTPQVFSVTSIVRRFFKL